MKKALCLFMLNCVTFLFGIKMPENLDKVQVEQIVRNAGKILVDNFGSVGNGSAKENEESIVTEADLKIDAYLQTELAKLLPGSSFITEESGQVEGSDYCWVIDPIDGTTNFAKGMPYCCISVALTHKHQPVLAYVYNPLRNEMFSAEIGKGSFLNGKQIYVSKNQPPLFAAVEFPYGYDHISNSVKIIDQLKKDGVTIRMPGSTALDLAYTACGIFDGGFSLSLKWWDVAAGILLITEAGGAVSDSSSGKVEFANFKSLVFGNAEMQKRILAKTKQSG